MIRRSHSKQSSPPPPSEGAADLARLLDSEARLEEMLCGARAQAAGLVTAARDAAAAREAALTSNLDAICHELEVTIEDERQRQEQEVAEAARRDAVRFEQTSPEQIEALAHYVVERVVGVDP